MSLCSLLGIPCVERCLFRSLRFFASLLLKLGNFKVGGIVIFCAEEVSVLKVDNVASNCFSWTVWNFVTDTWFLLLIFLVSSTHATLCYVVPKVSVHARPINCFTRTSQAAFNSCVGTMESFAYLRPQAGRDYTS